MRVVFTARSEQQLDDLTDYIANESGEARAEAYVSRIIAYCEGLRTFPRRGARRDDLLPGLRTVGFERRVVILFAIQEDHVLIEGVFYGGQDIDAAFDTE